ncbi:uncharacterized protein, partial [Sinocyclocheilus grahami]|uniref:uncharacterized protein n=1 Tax=Sinocyclocheilus grahami TaxID=75366 RepID=UPI0007AD669C
MKNPFYPSRSDESPEEVFFRGKQYHGPAELDEMEQPSSGLMLVDGADQDGASELNEVNESGFDEEMLELDESISPGDTMERHHRELLIHVIPPSLCNSEEQIDEGLSNGVKHNTCDRDEADAPKKRRGSVMTIITGDCEHVFSFDEEHQIDALNPVGESPTASPIEDLACIREVVEELQDSSQARKTTTSANSMLILHIDTSSQQSGEVQTNEPLDKTSTDVYTTAKLYKNYLSERQSASKNSLEVKEHLRPPTDSIHKDSEEHSDHWARRRKLFKESKQRSSAGGSSITSNITEESVLVAKSAPFMGHVPQMLRAQMAVSDGAAEEAGLQVGDYVLAVNGTNVTMVPHSEAADLARQ